MFASHILLIWAHLLAAIGWIGGMVFLSLVLAPAYRSVARTPEASALFRTAALRFRMVVWTAVSVLLLTGPLLVMDRGWTLFEPAGWPPLLALKISLVSLLVLMTAVHDVVLGPRVATVLGRPSESRTVSDRVVLMSASWLPRFTLMLAAGIVFIAVALARS